MRLLILSLLSSIIFALAMNAQSLSVFDFDASNFPTMRAKFWAFDAEGNQITNLTPSDFLLTENGESRNVTFVSCPPPNPPQALSSVLTIDVSGSMGWGSLPNINLAKEAARAWVEGLPLGKSECAITSFDSKNYLNQDFTTDRDKLLTAINNLRAMGLTDYDAALLNPQAGGLQISKNGKYQKVIVFLTDGMPNKEPQTSKIIQEARQQGVIIFGVTLGMPCPQSIKDITTQTGGMWFENVTTEEQARQVYQQILQTAQGGAPCTIEWEGGISCFAGITNVELTFLPNEIKATTSYQSPNTAVAKLEFNPTSLKFENPAPGVQVEQKVTVKARNANFTVTNITSNNAAFTITPTSFVLNVGQSRELTVSYYPADSGYVYCRFDIENNICPTRYYASGGWRGIKPTIRTIKLIHPNGGEVFVAGSDTVITWEGVPPDEPVKLEYRTDDDQPWITIAEKATGLSCTWRVPRTPSNQCLARVTAAAKSMPTSDIEMVLIPAGTFQMGNTGAYSSYIDEKPVHTVTISRDFWMGKYEVTQEQYEAVMGTNPSHFKGENLPVEMVSWYDAIEFCNRLSDIEGLERVYNGSGDDIICNWYANGYRLPTEAEWEYAAKAGTTTDFYSGSLTHAGSITLDPNLDRIGWYYCNSVGIFGKPYIVGQKEPNAFGLYDMSGNVREWCWDWYGSSYYYGGNTKDPNGPTTGSRRVLRGGSWNDSAENCCSSYRRNAYYPNIQSSNRGFRIVRNY